jgi:transaldolase
MRRNPFSRGTKTMPLADLKVKIFMDGAELGSMRQAMESMPFVAGFTTNPSLMRKAGVSDYAGFAREALGVVGERPISFEVFSDDFETMEKEARIIASWGGSGNVKIPVTNSKGESSAPLIRRLSNEGISLNVTAIFTLDQVKTVVDALNPDVPSIVSLFSGRIADTGRDPEPVTAEAVRIASAKPKARLLWASCREAWNIWQADRTGCAIITVPPDILKKLSIVDMDLGAYSLDTVKTFLKDATAAGYNLLGDARKSA